MSEVVTLRLREALPGRLEVEGLTADRCASLSEQEIAQLPIWWGRQRARVGDFFDVRGSRSARLVVEGDLTRVDGLACGNAAGEVVIDGDAGRLVAAGMTGGSVEVRGNVADDAGRAMAGGTLTVRGGAGDRLGAGLPGASKGMTGGEILVRGDAGVEVGACMRRGLVVVGGSVGDEAGRGMLAGTIVAMGTVGAHPGRGNKRGSIVALGGVAVPATYRYACNYEPPHLRLLLTYLRRRYGTAIDEAAVTGRYARYCGDLGEPGKGEILVAVRP